jgi:hypothetical protein
MSLCYNNTTGCVKLSSLINLRGKKGPQGEQGPSGETLNALLFYDDVEILPDTETIMNYNNTSTVDNGVIRFTGTTNPDTYISFENQTITSTTIAEFYAHCDTVASSGGSDNYLTLYLEVENSSDDTIQRIDIDTRSIQKSTPTNPSHLSFGPTCYRVVEEGNGQKLTILKTSKYKFKGIAGKNYELSELKLIIKLRN